MLKLLVFLVVVVIVADAQECLDDFKVKITKQIKRRKTWRLTAVVNLNLKTRFKDWQLNLEFKDALLSNLKAKRVKTVLKTKGQKIVTLKARNKKYLKNANVQCQFEVVR